MGVGGRFVVAAIAPVDVANRYRRELFGREIERRYVDGMERTAERLEVAARESANTTGPLSAARNSFARTDAGASIGGFSYPTGQVTASTSFA